VSAVILLRVLLTVESRVVSVVLAAAIQDDEEVDERLRLPRPSLKSAAATAAAAAAASSATAW
jgi:hypothetical protein